MAGGGGGEEQEEEEEKEEGGLGVPRRGRGGAAAAPAAAPAGPGRALRDAEGSARRPHGPGGAVKRPPSGEGGGGDAAPPPLPPRTPSRHTGGPLTVPSRSPPGRHRRGEEGAVVSVLSPVSRCCRPLLSLAALLRWWAAMLGTGIIFRSLS